MYILVCQENSQVTVFVQLCTEALATAYASGIQDFSTGLCGHTCSETVATFTDPIGWLKRTFHDVFSRSR